jgi:hypothetical protein
VVELIAAEAHRRNEQTKGKEGGRVVQKLLADWVEVPLQREVSRRPDDYRRSEAVEIVLSPEARVPDAGRPELTVRFV